MANKQLEDRDPKQYLLYQKYHEELQRLTIPALSSFIVEEPEQILFPDTQMELMDSLISYCNGERKHELTVTTHSPYIVNQLNLLFKRFDEKDMDFVGIDFDEVSVYAINEGRVANLKLRNAHLVNPEYLSAPLDKIYNLYDNSSLIF